ncbi:MAG: CopD family protein [Burkholderiaceae bacterium]
MNAWLLIAHLLGVIVWIGGMFFVITCLRPVVHDLQPQQRAPLMAAVLGRFFGWVSVAIALIWASGLARLAQVGFALAPPGWHAMLLTGTIMTVVFVVIRTVHFRRLQDALARGEFPAAGASLERIRALVQLNLLLGAATIVFAKWPTLGI